MAAALWAACSAGILVVDLTIAGGEEVVAARQLPVCLISSTDTGEGAVDRNDRRSLGSQATLGHCEPTAACRSAACTPGPGRVRSVPLEGIRRAATCYAATGPVPQRPECLGGSPIVAAVLQQGVGA